MKDSNVYHESKEYLFFIKYTEGLAKRINKHYLKAIKKRAGQRDWLACEQLIEACPVHATRYFMTQIMEKEKENANDS